MKDNEIFQLFFSRNAIDAEGRAYLVGERFLDERLCRKMGIASCDNLIYFSFGPTRYKVRSSVDKSIQWFNRLTEAESKGFIMPYFNQQDFVEKDYIILTEGEFDAVAVACMGYENVVSLPNGSASTRKSLEDHFQYLQDFKQIYFCFDMDEAGERAIKDAKKIIPPTKFRRINLPYKDANDLLKNENKDDAIEIFKTCFNQAEKYGNQSVLADEDLDIAKITKELEIGAPSGFRKLDQVIKGFRGSEVTVVTADTGIGKTTFCINLIYNMLMKNIPCWVNSYEMSEATILRKFWSLFLKKNLKTRGLHDEEIEQVKNWTLNNKLFLNPFKTNVDIQSFRKSIEYAFHVHNVKFVLVDHLDYLSSSGKKEKHYENVDDTMRSLHDIAMEYNVHILLVVHPKQTNSKIVERSDLKGSAGIKQYADNILSLARKSDIEKNPNDNRIIIDVLKNRMFGVLKPIELNYVAEYDGFVEI